MDDVEVLDRLYRTVYRAARAGEVDCTDAFDLAASVLELEPADPDATELASLSLDCAEVSRPRLAGLALTLLAEAGFQPGFTEEPEWLTRLEDAMRLVNQDVAATGLPDRCRLRVDEEYWPGHNGNAHAETWDGHSGTGVGVFPASGADPVSALVAVAEDAQDAVMHMLWSAWPVCPVHRLGVHARSHDGAAVWWCGDGHAVAAIGAWQDR
ncbi:hypothetical protein KZ829_14190 [Actinoplanes hulinensis]|uniref:Uncharacterized protein n=1 Tax=Actinoplanes hulinensis TaxID=1144547 RepID=A0ABS7B3L0_9ACTN|nr:hypothetical protein [Actinoplanes hulinensis]MBW6434888.1 hypothetical protein [Actinoplanes hulinensis]